MTGAELVSSFGRLEAELAEERGSFVLFALSLREEAFDRWDLIVAAPWLGTDQSAAVKYLVAQIKSRLGEKELRSLSTILVADPANANVQAFTRSVSVEHGRLEIRDDEFFGVPVKRAYVITSQRPPEPKRATA